MSKARYVADLLADSGDVKATKLDEFGALKDLSNVGTLPAALQSQLVGPAGPAGAAGAAGSDGADSTVAGPAGAAGSAGAAGAVGAAGANGVDGSNGTDGVDGVDGVGGVKDFVASGTLSNGTTVILKSNGTVEAVTYDNGAASIPQATPTVLGNAYYGYQVAFDDSTSGSFILASAGTYSQTVLTAGTLSGTTLTFGTAVTISGLTALKQLINVSAGKFLISHQDPSYNTSCRVIEVSGTTLTTSASSVIMNTGNATMVSLSMVPNTTKFVATYQNYASSSHGTARVGTISGTSISFGTAVVFNAAATAYVSSSIDATTSKLLVTYKDEGNSDYATACVGTVSGTSISFGTESVITSDTCLHMSSHIDPNTSGSVVVVYKRNSLGKGKVGVISGTSVTWGAEFQFNSGDVSYNKIIFNPSSAGKFLVSFQDNTNASAATVVEGTVSGTSATVGSKSVIVSYAASNLDIAFNPFVANQFLTAFRTVAADSYIGRAVLGKLATAPSTNLTATNFIGISSAAYANAATASIVLAGGVSANQTGLTINSVYYVQTDGTISTTAGNPSVEAGRALSSTELLLTSEAGATGATGAAGAAGAAGPTGAQGEFNFIGTLFTYSITAGPLVGSSGTVDVVDGDVFRLSGYTGYNNSFGNGLYVAVNNFSLTKSQTQSAINAELQSHFYTDFEYYLGDGSIGADGADGVGGVRDFVATGTLPNGQAVELMADGTVRAVSAPIIPRNIPSASNGVVFENVTTTHTWQGFDVKIDSTNPDRFIVAYRGTSGSYGACVLGTVSGTTITFGTEVIFSSEATTTRQISFAPNSSGKFAISYRKTDPGYTAGIKIGTISGTSITFGTEVVVSSATTYFHSCAFDLVDNNKLVAMYSNSGTYIKVGTVSGTSVSFGSQVSVGINSGVGLVKSVGTSKFIILVAGTVKIGTVSGTTLSLGTAVSLPWDNVEMAAMAVNPIDLTSFIVQYKGKNNSVNKRNGTMVAGTISGTSITLGSYVEFFPQNDTGARDHAIEFSPHSSGKFAYMYSEDVYNDAVVNTGSVSGTTITLDTITEIHTESDHSASALAFMSGGKFVYVTKIGNQNNFTGSGNPLGSAHVGQMQATGASTLNSLSYVGLSSAAYTDGQTASIILKGGVSENQSGLTAGSRYYIQGDGTLGTSEATPSVEAGLAINATTLLLSGPAGEDGVAGAAGSQGVQGIQGTAGLGINFLGQVAAISNLPSGSNTQGDAYIVQADDSFHVWDGTSAWVSGGSIQGPQGVQGIQGIQGIQGTTGTTGAAGTNGTNGTTGAAGPAGTPALVLISQATAPTSPALGQQWFDTSQGVLYEYLTDGTDSSWLDVSSGSQYAASSGSGLASTVSTTDPLVTSNPSEVGYLWINSTSGMTYVCTDITTDANIWVNVGVGTTGVSPGTSGTGGTITTYTSGGVDYKVHTFTSSGTLVIESVNSASVVEYLMVAGGGAGGYSYGAGGGGGGFLTASSVPVIAQTYAVTVGAGGSWVTSNTGGSGSNSSFNSITSIGGGGGADAASAASSGGSGGGGAGLSSSYGGTTAGAAGTNGQGNSGGAGANTTIGVRGAGGGGGASASGGTGTSSGGGAGGNGTASSLSGSSVVYAGGGGGGVFSSGGTTYSGGLGGGGASASGISVAIDATANSGGGGGGGTQTSAAGNANYAPGNGGSGIVIIRYAV